LARRAYHHHHIHQHHQDYHQDDSLVGWLSLPGFREKEEDEEEEVEEDDNNKQLMPAPVIVLHILDPYWDIRRRP
jgi:hypothetical protein